METALTITPANRDPQTSVPLANNDIFNPRGTSEIHPKSPFIEANCESVTLSHLRDECITPVFTKCNSVTISHYDFIQATTECVLDFYKGETIMTPQIRVSHKILGRIQEALKKPKTELLPHEETIFWERAAFAIEIPSITMEVGGNTLSLVVGGVRTFQNQNLYSKKTVERFKLFSGFVNNVCTNTCVNTDGVLLDVRVVNLNELKSHIYQLLTTYDMNAHVNQLRELEQLQLTQNQFCQLIGKSRLYQHLPKELKADIPELLYNDGQINAMAKAYIEDENFKCNENGEINLWKLFNLYTGANKSSYIDSFLERSENAFSLAAGIAKAINGDDSYRWYFLS
jgi:6-pyruvoyl-tetrahydropterin synthase